ncbi:MAG: polysaccharide deacetylase family protein [Terrimicrobiaceae bacterium]
MKRSPIFAVLIVIFLAACNSAQTQTNTPAEPRVIVVPPDEMSRPPSLTPATTATPSAAAPIASLAIPQTPQAMPRKAAYNSCNVSDNSIAITFDDGPHPQLTPKLLDLLKERGIKATFYVVGKNVETYPEITKRIIEEGHELGNHTWNHPALPKIGAAKVKSEMDRTTEIIVKTTGVKPATMRPPYGATNATLNKRLDEEFGMKVILWSVDPQDWKYRNADRVANHLIENTKAGGILLAHDIHPSTIAAMPRTLDTLTAKGFKFVTVSELLAKDGPVEVVKREVPATVQP